MTNILDSLFNKASECKDNGCKISKKEITSIYKPDLGLKDKILKGELFGSVQQPKFCDCLILKNDNTITLLEIKCGTVTNHILKEIIEQIENVYRVLDKKEILVNRCIFICKKFDSPMIKKKLLNLKIKKLPLMHEIYINTAIEI